MGEVVWAEVIESFMQNENKQPENITSAMPPQPNFGTAKKQIPIRIAASARVKKSRVVCLPKPFKIPEDTESVIQTGKSREKIFIYVPSFLFP